VTVDLLSRAMRDKDALPLTEWAHARYILHMRGRSYSASLKLQMLLGAPVVAVASPCQEFYYPALVPGKHYVPLPTPLRVETAGPALDEIMGGDAKAEANARRIGVRGREFVRDELAMGVVDCYWAGALIRYGGRYAQLAAVW
jgi:Glycosyl transferase family 90